MPPAKQEAMGDVTGSVEADNITSGVDTEDPGRRGTRVIDAAENTFAEEESVVYPARIGVPADDIALRVDAKGKSGLSARVINSAEVAILEQESMRDVTG